MTATEDLRRWLAWVRDAIGDEAVDEAGVELAAYLQELIDQEETPMETRS